MRSVNILLVLLPMMVLAACFWAGCATSTSPLIGTWERLDEHGVPTGQIKVLNDTHFAFGSPNDRGAVAAGGGTWQSIDSTYTETIQYHYQPSLEGRVLTFRWRLENGLWHHYGSFRLGQRTYTLDETWRRLPM